MYKFEIYRSTLSTPTTLDFAEFNRYDVGSYIFEREIQPIWDELLISGERERGRMFFREKLKGSLNLIGADYDWAYSVFRDANLSNQYRYIKISKKRDGVWVQEWRGFFNIADGEFDLARCHAEFSDILVFDEYSSIIENIQREKNLIDLPVASPVSYNANQYPYDEIKTTETLTINTNFCSTSYASISIETQDIEYILYRKEYRLLNAKLIYSPNTGSCSYTATFSIIRSFRRDYQYADSDPGVDWEDSGETSDTGVTKWVRHYRGDSSPTYGLKKTAKNYQVYPSYEEAECDKCKLYEYDYTSNADAESAVSNTRGRLFSSMMNYIVDDVARPSSPSSDSISSLFFYGVENPITEEDNTLNTLVVWQLSDMKPTSDAATIGMYSLQDIENFLLMFQVFWYIDDDGFFRIEHIKYFKQGLSYTGNSIGLDISADENMTGKNKISYIEDLPQEERHKFAYSVNADFVGVPIRYNGNIVNRSEESSVKEYNFNDIATDLTQVVSNPSDIGNEGFFIAATELIDGSLSVRTINGILSDIELYNGHLSVSLLQDYYWKYWRSMPSGIMNTVSTTLTQKKVLIQEDIEVTNCDQFDPYKLVRTKFGDGNVEEYERSLKDGKLTLTLSYSA